MSRTGRRVSRGLIALLVVVAAIGGISYLRNTSKSVATEARTPSAPNLERPAPNLPAPNLPAPNLPAPQTEQPPEPLISRTPTTSLEAPAPQVGQPTTQPGESSATASASELAERGFALKQKGELIAARGALNAALAARDLSDADADRLKAALSEISQTVVFSSKRFADDDYGGAYPVKPGERLASIADAHEVTWELLCRLNNLSDPRKLRAGSTIKVIKGPFHAVVNKRAFTMDLYVGAPPGEKGAMFVKTYRIGLGKDDSTPTGVWLVKPNNKVKNPTYYSPRGEGVIDANDPKNPLGERWIGLTGIDGRAVGKDSYGIHGTIEPESIGKQSSMGCIRMFNEDAEVVYDLLVEGKSLVIIKD